MTCLAAPGEVQNLKPQSAHVPNTPSQISLIEMSWDLPEGYTEVEGYYYIFSTASQFTLDEDTTSALSLVDTAYASSDYSGSNDISIYFYVAAVVYDEYYDEEIGATARYQYPLRIDTESPSNASLSASQYVNTQTINLTIGGFGSTGDATQVYLSNTNFGESGQWDDIVSQTRTWPLSIGEGRKTIYARFKDDAENSFDKSIFTIFDETSPRSSLTNTVSDYTSSQIIPITVTFNDPKAVGIDEISGFDAFSLTTTDFTVLNGTITNLSEVYSSDYTKLYTLILCPVAEGFVSLTIPEGIITDRADNANTQSEPLQFTYDKTRPSVILSTSASQATNQSPIQITATFNEPITGFESIDISVTNGNVSDLNAISNNQIYTFLVTPQSNGQVSLCILENSVSDGASNTNIASSELSRTYDSQPPGLTITSEILHDSITERSPIGMTITFSEPVYQFIISDITFTNASGNQMTGENDQYSFELVPSMPAGLTQVGVQVIVNANVTKDAAQNNNLASQAFSFTYTTERPGVNIQSDVSQSAMPDPILLTIYFNRPVSGFDVTDLDVNNANISNFMSYNGDGSYTSLYTCILTPTSQHNATVAIAANIAQNEGGYTNTASATFEYDINDPPTLSSISYDLIINEDTISSSIPLTIDDADSDLLTITTTAEFANQITLCHSEDPDNCSHLLSLKNQTIGVYNLTIEPKANHDVPFTVTIMVSDPHGLTDTTDILLSIQAVNDPPVITLSGSTSVYTENASAIMIDDSSTIQDIDSMNFNSGYLYGVISENANSLDCLSIAEVAGIAVDDLTITYNGTSIGVLSDNAGSASTLTITWIADAATLTAVQTVARAISFKSQSDNPVGGNRTFSIQLSDGDGGNAVSIAKTKVLNVLAVNDPPRLTLTSSTPQRYTENDSPVSIDDNASFTDVDTTNFSSGTVTIQISQNKTENDRLGIRHVGFDAGQIGISGNAVQYANTTIGTFTGGGSETLVITFNPLADNAKTTEVLRHITFETISDNPSLLTRTVEIVMTDGNSESCTSNVATRYIQIQAIQDAPTIQFQTTPLVFTENESKKYLDSDVLVTDIDSLSFNGGYVLANLDENATSDDSLSLSPTNGVSINDNTVLYHDVQIGSYSADALGHELTITFDSASGPITATAILQSIAYLYAGDDPTQNREVTVSVSDGEAVQVATQTVQIVPVNDLPDGLLMNGDESVNVESDLPIGSTVAFFSANDIETASEGFIYTLVSGSGDDDNEYFTIEGNQLKTVSWLPIGTQDTLSIRVQVQDEHGGVDINIFTIHLPDINIFTTIPTLSEWGMIFFMSLLMIMGIYKMNQKRRSEWVSF